ncbi:MAG: hypothetical protein ACFB0G_11285 [Leptolyngbyaceae cyanobacterium]
MIVPLLMGFGLLLCPETMLRTLTFIGWVLLWLCLGVIGFGLVFG